MSFAPLSKTGPGATKPYYARKAERRKARKKVVQSLPESRAAR
ncbi:MAG TPA: hypothetical protein VN669_14865 [Candidatus Acidoferrales bacterium]|nr:hypothetical protein [Candidatus Acidoferrales bacterium]